MTDPRELFARAVPRPAELDLGAVRGRAAALRRRRRAGLAAAALAAVVGVGGTTAVLLGSEQEALVPAETPPSASAVSPSPSPSPSSSPASAAPSASAAASSTQVFFMPSGGASVDCEDVVPVDRQLDGPATPTRAVTALLSGPTEDERAAGLTSMFGPETAGLLRSVRVEDGVAYVDLNRALQLVNNVGTSCASSMLLAQLTATLVQFQDVEEAVFALEQDPTQFYSLLERGCPDRLRLPGGGSCDPDPFTTDPPGVPRPDCPGGPPSSYAHAAACLVAAYVAGDRATAAQYATSAAVEELFALTGVPDTWRERGCGRPSESSPSSGVACHYYIPAEVHGTYWEFEMRSDFLVEGVFTLG